MCGLYLSYAQQNLRVLFSAFSFVSMNSQLQAQPISDPSRQAHARHRGTVLNTLVVIKIQPRNTIVTLEVSSTQPEDTSEVRYPSLLPRLALLPRSECFQFPPDSYRRQSILEGASNNTNITAWHAISNQGIFVKRKAGPEEVGGISCITLISSVSPSLSIHPAYKSCSPNLSYHRSRRRTELNPPRCVKWGGKAPSSTYQCPWKHKDIASRTLANKNVLARNKTLSQSQRNEERRRRKQTKYAEAVPPIAHKKRSSNQVPPCRLQKRRRLDCRTLNQKNQQPRLRAMLRRFTVIK